MLRPFLFGLVQLRIEVLAMSCYFDESVFTVSDFSNVVTYDISLVRLTTKDSLP